MNAPSEGELEVGGDHRPAPGDHERQLRDQEEDRRPDRLTSVRPGAFGAARRRVIVEHEHGVIDAGARISARRSGGRSLGVGSTSSATAVPAALSRPPL